MIPATYVMLAAFYTLLGLGICRRLRLPSRGAEGFAWAYGLGTGAASLWLLALVWSGVWRATHPSPPVAWIFVALPALAVGWPCLRSKRGTVPLEPTTPASRTFAVRLSVFLGLFAYFLPGLVGSETGWDALAYHLPAADRMAKDGITGTIGLLDGEFRLGFDLLFMPGLVLDGEIPDGPACVHFVAALALAAGIAAEVGRRTSRGLGVVVATLFVLSPGVAWVARHAYVDVGVGLYVFLALAAASRALKTGDRASVVAAGLFAGFALNAKLPAGAAIPAVAVTFVVGRGLRRGAYDAAWATAVAAVVAAPWFVRAYIDTANPFFPALLDRFGSGWADRTCVESVKRSVLDQLALPRDVWLPFRGIALATILRRGGFEAPAWVIAFLPAGTLGWGLRDRRGLVAGAIVLFLAWGAFVPMFRFGIGVWAWGAVAAAVGMARLAMLGRSAKLTILAVLVVLLGAGGLGLAKTVFESDVSSAKGEVERFGSGVARFPEGAATPEGPVGLTSSLVALVPVRAIALEPLRNGVLLPSDFDDPDRLLAACRRLGLRSMVLDETTDKGQKAIACARVWAARGLIELTVDEATRPSERVVVVVFPP